MRVFVVRHGEAADVPGERPLTAAGRAEVARLALWCKTEGVAPHEIRHSGILRAAETAEILAARLAPPGGVSAARGLAPGDDPEPWKFELGLETDPLMLVTHMPFVSGLVALLTGARIAPSFATAEIACFERTGDDFRLVASWRPG